MSYRRQFFFLLGDSRRRAALVVALLVAASVLDLCGVGLVWPYVTLLTRPEALDEVKALQALSKAVGVHDARALVLLLGYVIIGLFVVKAYVGYRLHRYSLSFAYSHQAQLVRRLLTHYRRQRYEFFLQRNSSRLIQDLSGNSGTFALRALLPALKVSSELVLVLAMAILLAVVDPLGALILAAVSVVGLVIYDRSVRRWIGDAGRDSTLANQRLWRESRQTIVGIKELRVLGTEQRSFDIIRSCIDRIAHVGERYGSLRVVPRYGMEAVLVTFVIIVASQAIGSPEDTAAVMARLGVFGVAAARLVPSFNQIVGGLGELRFARTATSLLYESFHDTEHGAEPEAIAPPEHGARFSRLDVRDVYFTYHGAEKPALRGIDLSLTRGQAIGIAGPSGAGKSTLIDVLLGLLEPQQGSVELNGRSIADNLGAWRRHVAYIPQDPYLIDDTIRANVALGVIDAEVDETRVREAMNRAQLGAFLDSLPRALDTRVGEDAVRFSGGQKQRLALARSFYFRREVVFFDEVTSALDPETEEEVLESIRRLHGETTTVIISHRPAALKHCDTVYRMQEGRLFVEAEEPTHLRTRSNQLKSS